MSIYCHLCCVKCREAFHVKDADTCVYVEPSKPFTVEPLSQFLEKHAGHELRYLWEEDTIQMPNGRRECPADEWPRFNLHESESWSHGTLYELLEDEK